MGKNIFIDQKRSLRIKDTEDQSAIKDIEKGELFNKNNIRCLRPKIGISPKHYDLILGKKSPIKIKSGEPIKKKIYLQIK